MVGGPGVTDDEDQDYPKCYGEVVKEIHVAPQAAFLAVFLYDAEDVKQHDYYQRYPAQDCAVRAIVEGRVDGEHGCLVS